MKLTLALSLLALLLYASPATSADNGFFVGAGGAQVDLEVDDVYGTGIDFDEGDTGFKVFGGYRFFPWLSVEGIYLDGGSPAVRETVGTQSASLSIETQTLVGAAVFALPIGKSFEIFVKPGFAYWDAETKLSYSSPGFSFNDTEDDEGSAFFIGAGAGWTLDNFGVRLEYEWFEVAPEYNWDTDEFEDELDADARILSLSFLYRF